MVGETEDSVEDELSDSDSLIDDEPVVPEEQDDGVIAAMEIGTAAKKNDFKTRATDGELDATRLYLNEIGYSSLLTAEEEVYYARLAQKGDESARATMIESNLRLVVKIARRYMNRGLALLDLIEEKYASSEFLQKVRKMDELAGINLDNESRELILVGHATAIAAEAGQIFRPVTWADWGIDGEIEFNIQDVE